MESKIVDGYGFLDDMGPSSTFNNQPKFYPIFLPTELI